jgi:hypothetical protein
VVVDARQLIRCTSSSSVIKTPDARARQGGSACIRIIGSVVKIANISIIDTASRGGLSFGEGGIPFFKRVAIDKSTFVNRIAETPE